MSCLLVRSHGKGLGQGLGKPGTQGMTHKEYSLRVMCTFQSWLPTTLKNGRPQLGPAPRCKKSKTNTVPDLELAD